MTIKFEDISDLEYANLIAYFVKKKGVCEIIIHTEDEDITITHKKKSKDDVAECIATSLAILPTVL